MSPVPSVYWFIYWFIGSCRLLPADAALPGASTLERPERLGTDSEAAAVFEALRDSVDAVAGLLVPDAARRAALLAGEESGRSIRESFFFSNVARKASVDAFAEILVPDAARRAALLAGDKSLHHSQLGHRQCTPGCSQCNCEAAGVGRCPALAGRYNLLAMLANFSGTNPYTAAQRGRPLLVPDQERRGSAAGMRGTFSVFDRFNVQRRAPGLRGCYSGAAGFEFSPAHGAAGR